MPLAPGSKKGEPVPSHRLPRVLACAALGLALVACVPVAATAKSGSNDGRLTRTAFYAPGPTLGAKEQIVHLLRQGQIRDAFLIAAMSVQPTAVWITQGTPAETRAEVRGIVRRAKSRGAIPVLVAYNIPGRDCAGLSAGGATTTAAYKAWIDGFAKGLGNARAVVILEPDGLGLLPSNCGGPNPGYPFTDTQRYEELNYAVNRLGDQPGTDVYLDGTHSRWLSVGDISLRLVTAGVQRARGFFVNVSNFQPTEHLVKYGTWISKCIHWGTVIRPPWAFDGDRFRWEWCASQYFPANVDDFATWGLTDTWYDEQVGNPDPALLTKFVVDTSRNGQGRWIPPVGKYTGDPLDWCNPPGRGLGQRATTTTGSPLADAFLWVKVPGESDGTCARGGAPPGSVDPEWGVVDPAAGQWFPQQALELARLANPPLF